MNLGAVVKQLKNEHKRAVNEVNRIAAALKAFGGAYGKGRGNRTMSAAGRARISAAQKARWAKVKKSGGQKNVVTMPKRRTMSAAARKKIAAAQRARWAKVKTSQQATA
ncbi:MAG TPA: hypothetical protein VI386_23650 [Candidatus Sulfotelmatobacter sp.]